MKIGIFTECYKPILNGVVNSIIGFKMGLEKLGHEVYIFCPTYKGHKNDPKDKNIIHCKSFALPGKSGYHFIFPLSDEVKKIAKGMDIIHVQHPFIMGDRAADTSEKYNIPITFTNHTQYDQYAHYIPISKKFVIKSIINYIKGFTKRVDLIIAPAKGIQDKLQSYGVKTPIMIVPNGIDVARFSKKVPKIEVEKLRKKYKIDVKNDVLIFTGRIAEEKNLTFLIKSFKKVLEKKPNTTLLLVGGGMELDKFQQLVKDENLEGKAIITDFIPYKFMQNYLALATFYVTASKSEVHPLTLLEGMAARLPIIIVNAPGTGDIITDKKDGLVAKDDMDDFVNQIIKLLDDKKLLAKLSKGAKQTSKQYSFLATSKTMLKAYSKVIALHNDTNATNKK